MNADSPQQPPFPPAPAPVAHHTGRVVLLLVAVGALAVGLLAGHVLTWLAFPGYFIPTARQLNRLCTPDRGVQPRPWTHIILHHSAADTGDAASIDNFHRLGRGWERGLGYDFVIGNGHGSRDGQIEVSRRWKQQLDGAHCKADDMNTRGIGICFVGNFESHSGPTDAQLHAGLALVRHLAQRFRIPSQNILGHREVKGAQTDCPGRHFPLNFFRAAAF